MSMKKWGHPKNYMGKTYYEYYVFLGQTRDSDPLEWSNFETPENVLRSVLDTIEDDEQFQDFVFALQAVANAHAEE